MEVSLGELLAKDGFKGRRSKFMGRSYFASLSASARQLTYRDGHQSGSPSGNGKTERRKSDFSRYSLRDESPTSVGTRGRRLRDNLIRREVLYKESTKEASEKVKRHSYDLNEFNNRSSSGSLKGFSSSEIVEVGVEDGKGHKEIYSNEDCRPDNKYSTGISEMETWRLGKDIEVDNGSGDSPDIHPLGHLNKSNNYRKSDKSSHNSRNLEDSGSQKPVEIVQNVAEPALDEVVVQAMISILGGYIKPFLKEEDFRTSLCHNCFTVLNLSELDEGIIVESKVIASLQQAIETVERAAEQCASEKEVKKASLQLSVITGLSSEDLKDGFTTGIPNSKLSACAHLYLSVICILQKKDRRAAKHLLQVFCDSPFQARTTLLPDLWEHIFLPHLSNLKAWYNQVVDSLENTVSKKKKLKLLEEVYNESLDSGTYQFSVYYKDWLTEGAGAPSIPSINIPSITFQGVQRGRSQSYSVEGIRQEGPFSHFLDVETPSKPFSPQPMVSKRLYDVVVGHSHKLGINDVEEHKGAENFDRSTRSSGSYTVEDRQALTRSSSKVKHIGRNIDGDNSSHHEDAPTAEEDWRVHEASAGNYCIYPENPESTQISHTLLDTKASELTFNNLAKSVFELQEPDESINLTPSTSFSYPDSIKMRYSDEELHGGFENIDGEYSTSSIPQDFICPLTGLVFEDPVTLETGQTFERAAVAEWFSQGNRMCPVTGETLECQSVPVTNFILKRVIDSWKSENYNQTLAFASQAATESRPKPKAERSVFILQQLLTDFSDKERIINAKLLISVGGLQFLVRRFESGNMEAKTHVAALFSSCIEAKPSCRDYIARNINKSCLLELINSNEDESRTTALSLLMELICLKRRKDVRLFLSGLLGDGVLDTMHVLLLYLQRCKPEERPLVAVLLLHLDLLVEPRKYSTYREAAVDAITVALDGSLSNEKIRTNCCRALLILGGRFSSTGKIMTEDWILKQTGFLDGLEFGSLENEEDDNIPSDDEGEREEWLGRLSVSLIGDGKKSFLESTSECLGSGSWDLVKVCLTTVAWLSSALASLPDTNFRLSDFPALISLLKEILKDGEQVEHRVLASLSLLNISEIPECRVLLMTSAQELMVPARRLAEETWTAKELYTLVSGEDSYSAY